MAIFDVTALTFVEIEARRAGSVEAASIRLLPGESILVAEIRRAKVNSHLMVDPVLAPHAVGQELTIPDALIVRKMSE